MRSLGDWRGWRGGLGAGVVTPWGFHDLVYLNLNNITIVTMMTHIAIFEKNDVIRDLVAYMRPLASMYCTVQDKSPKYMARNKFSF